MHTSIRHVLSFFLQFGGFGVFLLAIADDSFLFLPIGTDLLAVVLIARHHNQFLLSVAAAAAGSTAGVFLLDLVCRRGGEKGLSHLLKPERLEQLKQRIARNATAALTVACLAPPPFPFSAYIAAASAFQYPRRRLLGVVFGARIIRYALLGLLAIYFGRRILRVMNSSGFEWIMGGLIAVCVIGSIASIIHWIGIGRANRAEAGERYSAP